MYKKLFDVQKKSLNQKQFQIKHAIFRSFNWIEKAIPLVLKCSTYSENKRRVCFLCYLYENENELWYVYEKSVPVNVFLRTCSFPFYYIKYCMLNSTMFYPLCNKKITPKTQERYFTPKRRDFKTCEKPIFTARHSCTFPRFKMLKHLHM